ncbi:McrC family protein [Cellulomonas bogoriensis]|uniref:McrBC 5-methylcytosine restriction system component n=1 Tax=Cellulomonas bogoriensis 69B4 = DSM 16987 TaxID=1386082 RepID=A0A0A0C333_9CELL|nr:hypothetical protein [Cellulomonas bogoriensis]KGM14427.1 McrBC 5-methylcytosine restriction system component [Cellulomonas bogoriensis 69B4 = DSM 16987]
MVTTRLSEWRTSYSLSLDKDALTVLQSRFGATVAPSLRSDAETRWDVTPGSTVGTVRRGVHQLVVLPKIPIGNVLYLLAVGSGQDPWSAADDAALADAPDLTSGVVSLFTNLLNQAVTGGVLRGFRVAEDDLHSVRGRIDIARQLRQRPGLNLPLAVTYNEHDADILENRLLLAATRHLRQTEGLPRHLSQALGRAGRHFADVEAVAYHADDVPPVAWNLLNARYRSAVELARLILRGTAVDIDAGSRAGHALTFDMNEVFEKFLVAAIGSALTHQDGRAQRQDTRWHLDEGRTIPLRPDLTWYGPDGTVRAVVDAKYKAERSSGPVNADVYQLLAYCTATGLNDGHLVYAAGEQRPGQVRVIRGGPVIHAHAINLSGPPADIARETTRVARHIAQAASPAIAL